MASPSLIKIICHDAVVDDGKRKIIEAVLLLIPSALTMIIKKYLSMSKSKEGEGETILLTNNKLDWEFAPSNKREETVLIITFLKSVPCTNIVVAFYFQE